MGFLPADMPADPPPLTAEEKLEVIQWLTNMAEVLEGKGKHAEHVRKQVGRCVHCSCGARVQGRLS